MQCQLPTVALVLGFALLLLGGPPPEALRPPGDEGPPIDDIPPEDPGPPIDVPPDCGPLSPVMRVTRTTPINCFTEALRQANNLVLLEHDVDLDLTGYTEIVIREGVTLTSAAPPPPPIGHAPPTLATRLRPVLPRDPWAPNPAEYTVARDARHLGPRIKTRSRPSYLFELQGDHIRLEGFRLEGPDFDITDGEARGLVITSKVGITIANMEFAGWSHSAIYIQDPDNRMHAPEAVTIQDSFFHHNQHKPGGPGYGIDLQTGAQALIERNVFDFNRHAIAASGDAGNEYEARHNLVLKGGGYHCWDKWANPGCIIDWKTHQFDVHGADSCFPGHKNCGYAGTRFVFLRNAFQYRSGNAIKIRGEPRERVTIAENVFPHPGLEDDWGDDAIHLQTGTKVTIGPGNIINVDTYGDYGVCDFDADGTDDLFLATGVTWWYASGGKMHWTYLKEATERLQEVGLGDFDGDGHCDVFAVNRAAQQWESSSGGRGPWTVLPGTYDLPFEALRFGHFNGDEDRVTDIFYRAPDGQWAAISPGFYDWRPLQSSRFPLAQLGFGDFDADGVTDVVAVEGGRWAVSWRGLTVWEELNPRLRDPLEDLLIADLDADGRDDIVRYTPTDSHQGTWEISWAGRTGWEPLATFTWEALPVQRPPAPAQDARTLVGRFNDQPGADVLAVDPPYQGRWGHLYSYGQRRFGPPHNRYPY